MTPETVTTIDSAVLDAPQPVPVTLPLCSNISSKGRRCRQTVTHFGSALCRTHSRLNHSRPAEANPLADLESQLSSFTSYSDVTAFLSRVLTLLSENRISPRRAAVLSYIANSILNSLRASERQALLLAKNQAEEPLQIDWSAMTRIEPDLPPGVPPVIEPPAPPTLDSAASSGTPPTPPSSGHQTPPSELFHQPLPPRPVSPLASHHRRMHWENRRSG